MSVKAAIAVLGGAITPSGGEFASGVQEAARWGMKRLEAGGSALDAVEGAVKLLEDNPIFNCGTGARLNLKGEVQMDAAIMDGRHLRAGAVSGLREIKNPVAVARKVMEETDHVLLAGEGGERFARAVGFEPSNPVTEARLEEWKGLKERLAGGGKLPLDRWTKIKKWMEYDTVGVVALDREGNLAVAASSGGGPMKLPGRVGDVAIPGCGLYADNFAGVAALTGDGELFIRYLAAKMIVDFMRMGMGAQTAVEAAMQTIGGREPKLVMAAIALDRLGVVGMARNVEGAPHAYLMEGIIPSN